MPDPTPLAPTTDPIACLTAWMRGEGADTLGGIEAQVRDNLAEFSGVEGAGDVVALRRAVLNSADKIAVQTLCLHAGYSVSLEAGRAEYCPPNLLKATSVLVKDTNGHWRWLPARSRGRGRHDYPDAANYPQSDMTSIFEVTGGSKITLIPTPLTARANALVIEGFYKPGNVWSLDPTTFAPRTLDASHTCPLPDYAIPALVAEATRTRIVQLAVRRPALLPVLPLWEKEAKELIGDVESTAAMQWQNIMRTRGSQWTGVYYVGR